MPKPGPAVRRKLYDDAAGRCCYCHLTTWLAQPPAGNPDPGLQATIEHILPRNQGGTSRWQNLALACKRCNTSRAGHPYLPYAGMTSEDRAQTRNLVRLIHRQTGNHPQNRRWGRYLRLDTIRIIHRANHSGLQPQHPRYTAGGRAPRRGNVRPQPGCQTTPHWPP